MPGPAKSSAGEFNYNRLASVQRFFAISSHTASEWKRTGMPYEKDETYDLKKIFHWWIESEKFKRTVGSRDETEKSLSNQKLAVEIEHKKLKLRNEAGELVDREGAKAAVQEMFHRVRARLLAAPEELGSSLPPELRASYTEDAKHKVSLILKEMENWSME